jgi:hypothetical protein
MAFSSTLKHLRHFVRAPIPFVMFCSHFYLPACRSQGISGEHILVSLSNLPEMVKKDKTRCVFRGWPKWTSLINALCDETEGG